MVVEDDDTNTCSHGCIHICSVDTHRHAHTYTNTQIFCIYWLREQSDSKFGLSSINHSLVLLLLLFFSLLYFFFTSLLFFQVRMCLLPFAFINISLTFSHTHVHSLTCIFSYGNCDFARERKKNCTHTHGRFFLLVKSLILFHWEQPKTWKKSYLLFYLFDKLNTNT